MREVFFIIVGIVIATLTFGLGGVMRDQPSQETASVSTPFTETYEEGPIAIPEPNTYRVVKVVDGDTLTLEKDGEKVTIRLIGLDTPETVDPRKPVQCFGNEASQKAKELLDGANISLETDASQGTYDKYGRMLAYVFLSDGTLFNEYMIAEGYGHEYTYSEPYKYQSRFKAAEQRAREEKKGLWSDDACSVVIDTKADEPIPQAPAGSYECTKNVYNCTSFKTHSEAQSAFDACGGSANDVHKLDNDRDGLVCESLP